MKISEDQLKQWAIPPATTMAEKVYEDVKKVLEASPILSGRKIDIYLQGSYRNHTNIKFDSDVDIVVQLNSVWNRDLSRLSPQEVAAYNSVVSNSSYGAVEFRRDVAQALTAHFGAAVDNEGNKSIKLRGNDTRLHADIVPALQYRIYTSFYGLEVPTFVEGFRFKSKDGQDIENFPKLHRIHGENKNSVENTGEHYKHLVRVLKNVKRQLVDNRLILPELAPSYFIECLVFNAPDTHFGSDYQGSLKVILDFLQYQCDADRLTAGNKIHLLFGDKPWQWNNKNDAALFLSHARNFLGI